MLRIEYQSCVDYRASCDILRCNRNWYGQERRDCVIVEEEDKPRHFARLRHLLRCKFRDNSIVDIAIITNFGALAAPWSPPTRWTGCVIVEEHTARLEFIRLAHITRGVLLCPAFGSPRVTLFYPIDTVDNDMFLRLNNL